MKGEGTRQKQRRHENRERTGRNERKKIKIEKLPAGWWWKAGYEGNGMHESSDAKEAAERAGGGEVNCGGSVIATPRPYEYEEANRVDETK